MNTSSSDSFSGVVPAACDAEAGPELSNLRSIVTELRTAIRSAREDERGLAEHSLARASELLEKFGRPDSVRAKTSPGSLATWQVRKVISHIDANLERTIRNDDLSALVRLTPSHFGRAFRNSVGEPPHEYVIRRRIERAQGLMLSTQAKLSDIALDCGLADQSHLTRLFRRIVGESPRAWRRARFNATA